MKPIERVMTAMMHKQPDRVPFFYRDTPEVEKRLLSELNLSTRDQLLDYLGIDFRWVEPTYVGPSLYDSRSNLRRDIWGVEYKYIKFSENAGYWEVISNPLSHCCEKAELENYNWPRLEWFDFSVLKQQVEKYEDYAIMTAPGVASPSLLQSPIQPLLGDEHAFLCMAMNQDFFKTLVQKILDFQLPFIERMLLGAQGRINFFRIGDDYGTQRGLLVGPDMWRQLIQPGLKAMSNIAKKHGAYYYHHSCGAISQLVSDLMKTGVDVLDPIQVTAKGMEPSCLKKKFGNKLVFSGGVDEQHLLPSADVKQVEEYVFDLLDKMAVGGGFFIGPTHNFQDDVPTQNILAMYEAAKMWKSKTFTPKVL